MNQTIIFPRYASKHWLKKQNTNYKSKCFNTIKKKIKDNIRAIKKNKNSKKKKKKINEQLCSSRKFNYCTKHFCLQFSSLIISTRVLFKNSINQFTDKNLQNKKKIKQKTKDKNQKFSSILQFFFSQIIFHKQVAIATIYPTIPVNSLALSPSLLSLVSSHEYNLQSP